MKPLVVLPTFNEAENITRILPAIRQSVPEASILVVDDGSPDGTAELATAAAAELGQIEVLRRAEKNGLGRAYLAGFAWGLEHGFDVLIEMDADFSHSPSALPDLIGAAASAEVVIGSRYVPGGRIPDWQLHRRLLSRWGNRYADAVLGLRVSDATAGFRAYRGELLQRLDRDNIRANGYGFQIEMTYRSRQAGARITEVPISFTDRVAGESKMSSRIVVEALLLVTWWGLRDTVRRRRPR